MNELEETRYLKSLAKNANLLQLLSQHEEKLVAQQAAVEAQEAAEKAQTATVTPDKATVEPSPVVPNPAPVVSSSTARSNAHLKYHPIDDFAWDQGGYNSEFVTVYVNLDGVGSVADHVKCEFTPSSFDLTVRLDNVDGRV